MTASRAARIERFVLITGGLLVTVLLAGCCVAVAL